MSVDYPNDYQKYQRPDSDGYQKHPKPESVTTCSDYYDRDNDSAAADVAIGVIAILASVTVGFIAGFVIAHH